MRRSLAGLIGATLSSGILACAAAAAVAPLQVEVLPSSSAPTSYFSLRTRPGRTVPAGRLALLNRSRRAITVELAAVDALTASTLGSAYALPGVTPHGATRWTVLSADRVHLGPGAAASVAVSARIPPGAGPGQYLSGISIEVPHRAQTHLVRSNVAIASIVRYAIGLELALPGPARPRLVWTGASLQRRPGGLTFLLAAGNRGNVIVQHVGGSILVTQGRRVVIRAPIGPGTFVTGTSIQYPVLAAGEAPAQGTVYRVRAVMRYGPRVARLDRTLVFGARDARTQRQFSGPRPVRAAGSTPSAALLAGGAAALALVVAIAFALGVRRGRG